MSVSNKNLTSGYAEAGTRGIHETQIDEAKGAIDSYKTMVKTEFDAFKEELDYTQSFFGEHQMSVKTHVDKSFDALVEVLQHLDDFKDAIDTAKENYANQDKALADSLAGGTSTGLQE